MISLTLVTTLWCSLYFTDDETEGQSDYSNQKSDASVDGSNQ